MALVLQRMPDGWYVSVTGFYSARLERARQFDSVDAAEGARRFNERILDLDTGHSVGRIHVQ